MNFGEFDGKGHVKCPFPNCDTKTIAYNQKLKDSIRIISNPPEMVNINASETDVKFFEVNDMWDFDNIGVSKPLEEFKDFKIDSKNFEIERLLICSECDKGPIGFAGHFEDEEKLPNTLKFFLSCKSMKYDI